MVVEYSSKVIVSKYLMDILRTKNRAYAARFDLITNYVNKDASALNLFRTLHNIESKEELDKIIHDARMYVALIKGDIYKRLVSLTDENLIGLMNNSRLADKFLKKYILTEEELKNDIFLQCG